MFNLFKSKAVKRLEAENTYLHKKIDYLYHLVMGMSRMADIAPSKMAEKADDTSRNTIYLNEVLKHAKNS